MEATAGFNAKHQQIVFGVTREFHALTAVRGKVAGRRAALARATPSPDQLSREVVAKTSSAQRLTVQ